MSGGHYIFPASFAQQRLWFLDQLEGASAVYNLKMAWRLSGPLDVDCLQRAVDAVVMRHESLRTSFALRDNEVVQRVASELQVPVLQSALPNASPEQLAARLNELASTSFDLQSGPLLRVHLLPLDAEGTEHVLLLVMHHIVSDAWSAGVLYRDLAAYYSAFRRGEPAQLPALPVQYADFAVWQRDWLAGAELEQQTVFWREHLEGAPPLLELPVDRPRPAVQSYRGNRLSRALPAALSASLQELAAAEGVTLYMLLFAAFNLLLARWSGQSDLVVGTPIAGRRRSELEALIGCFANTLAIRTRLDGLHTFRELLARVRSAAIGAFAHQELPFEKLVEVLQPPRKLAHSPLFQAMFILQNTPWETTDFGGLAVRPADIAAADTAKFELTVSVADFESKLWLALEYNSDLFEADTIDRLGAGFEALLTAIVLEPAAALQDLPVQAAGEQQLCARWNDTARPFDRSRSIWRLFVEQAARCPDAVAVEVAGRAWSYAQLQARAETLAAALHARGARPGQAVAICLERGLDMLACVLAVLRTGAHYVPLDPLHPPARLAFILEDSGSSLLVVAPALAGKLADFRGAVLDPAEIGAAASASTLPPPSALPAEGLAYLIYTSGSTGQPKGVAVPQLAVLNFLHSMAHTPGLAPADRLLAVTTLAFDIAVLELLLPLTVGACTVIATRDELADPRRLAQRLAESRIAVMQATPALWRNLLTAGWAGAKNLRMLCGGEALDAELAAALLARGAELWNMYGPTETTVWSCCARITAASALTVPPMVPVGRPIANTRCHVLDEQLRPVPRGVRGELWIGGEGVARGYHRQPALTAERFRADPFAPGPTAADPPPRMYRTGDRARWRSDGQLEILGRSDFQLKLRGFRIEPGEIEAALLAHPAVGAAVVVLREFAGDPRLVAFMVAASAEVPAGSLLAHLRQRLPEYMLPAEFVWLPALPLNPNGKLDRAALPAVSPAGTAGAQPDTGPDSPLESLLCGLFATVLGRRRVGRHEDFFALGGHSLLATQLIARIRDALQIELPLKTLFMSPTPAGIAAGLPVARVVPSSPVQPAATDATQALAPLSPVQQRMWFLDRLQPGSPVYNLAWNFRLRGVLDLTALQAAVDALVARHAVLRTRFVEIDGEPRQAVAAHLAVPLNVLGPDNVAGAWETRLRTCLQLVRFDLAHGPLLQVFVLPIDAQEQVLSIVVHHIVADGWSLGILGGELSALYNAALAGRPPGLPALPLQYADYARRQRAALAGGELERQLAWWRTQLADAPPFLDLPVDRPRPAVSSQRGARCSLLLAPKLQSDLGRLAQAEGCTLFMVLLAAFDVLLARYAGSEDIVVGTPIAGRPHTELEGLIGFFVNTLVLRTGLHGNPRFRELLQRVKQTTLEAWSHADVPFEQLVEALNPPRSIGRSPLFQVLFNLHNEPAGRLELAGLEATPLAVDRGTAKFELSVSLAESAAGLAVSFEYSTDLYLAASMQAMLADYAALLAAVVARPDALLAGLCTGSAPRPGRELPDIALLRQAGESTLAAAFAAQLQRHAEATAVSASAVAGSSGVEWTYAGLDQRARAVAAALLPRGVTRGARVGLWFNQGAGQVAAMLGVLQAGAAWVPLDPLAPAARLDAVVRDAGLRIVVSEAAALSGVPGSTSSSMAGGSGSAWLRQSGLELLLLDELPAAEASLVLPAGSPDDTAYLLYTSGTTGVPKRVAQSQRNVLHYVRSWAANLGLTAADRLSLVSTYGYDAAVQDIYGALLSGAAVYPLDIRRLDRETLLDRIADAGLTVLHATPTVYRYLFGSHVACRQDLSRVRLIVLGGEAARRADFELFKARFRRGAQFVNGYGLTEATAVLQSFSGHDTQPYGNVLSLGWPVGDQRVLLLDADGKPAGISGELVIESRYVPGGRLHTGDLARWLPDGSLAFLGRRDDQLKLAGIRIEPGEIEAALRSHPALDAVAVVLHTDAASEPMLVAYFSLRADVTQPTPAELRAHLRPLLPDALQPARHVPLDALPQLPNGKIDRRALASRPLPRPVSAGAGRAAAAEGHIEILLTELWQALLKREDVGPEDDFFALGGHSLLATRLIARLRDRLGVELPLIAVFETPTIRALAKVLAQLTERSEGDPVPASIGRQARPPLP